MLAKLLKLEIKSCYRQFALVWIGMLVMSLILFFEMKGLIYVRPGVENIISNILVVASWIIYVAVFVAMGVLTIGIIIMRFYKGMLGDEGYLVHTLPVREWQLITAKGIIAVVVTAISSLVAALSLMLLISSGSFAYVICNIKTVFGVWFNTLETFIMGVELIIIGLLGVAKTVYQVYASLSIGMLADKHRILISLGAYVGITVVLVALFTAVIVIFSCFGIEGITVDENTDTFVFQMFMLFGFVVEALQVVLFHVIAERLMTKRLKLI